MATAQQETAQEVKKAGGEPETSPGAEGAQKDLARPSAQAIFEQVATNARQELRRSSKALAISGLAGGTFMGLSALGNALSLSILGHSPSGAMVSKMFYPIGFIVVILGRAQLFTENTLYPVALVLAEKRHVLNTMRLWGLVLPANVLGALAFAALATRTSALKPDVLHSLVELGLENANKPGWTVFWSAVVAGWIIATAAWLVSGSHSISGSILIIWILTYVVGLGEFAHCIAGSGEVLAAVLSRAAPWTAYLRWFVPAVTGNICGGVGMVTLLEYGQVVYGGDAGSSGATE